MKLKIINLRVYFETVTGPARITELADYDVKKRSNKIRDIRTNNFDTTMGFAQNLEQNMVQVQTKSYCIKGGF